MRKLLLPLFASLLFLGVVAFPAQALSLPLPLAPLAAPDDEEAGDAEASDEPGPEENEAGEEPFECTIEDEEDVQLCAEIAEEAKKETEAEECVVEDATAKVLAHPGKGSVDLKIRYRAYAPASVAIDARLRGGKGGVHLGASHTRFPPLRHLPRHLRPRR